MKKKFGIIGSLSLALALTFSVTTESSAAISTTPVKNNIETINNSQLLNASRYVTATMEYTGNTAPSSFYYSDSYGYRGYIPLISKKYYPGLNFTQANYGGTVSCSGNCPMESILEIK